MHELLNGKILKLAEMIGIVFLIYTNYATGACRIYSAQSRIELDHIGSLSKRQANDGAMGIQRKDR